MVAFCPDAKRPEKLQFQHPVLTRFPATSHPQRCLRENCPWRTKKRFKYVWRFVALNLDFFTMPANPPADALVCKVAVTSHANVQQEIWQICVPHQKWRAQCGAWFFCICPGEVAGLQCCEGSRRACPCMYCQVKLRFFGRTTWRNLIIKLKNVNQPHETVNCVWGRAR